MDPSDLAGVVYPPAPWVLGGKGWVGAFAVDRELEAPEGLEPLLRRTLVVILNRYRSGPLRYDELVFAVPVVQGAVPALWISQLWVSSKAALVGGRRIWDLGKQLAGFTWDGERVLVADEDGPVCAVEARAQHRPLLPAPAIFPAIGRDPNARFTVRGWARPAMAKLRLSEWSLRFPFTPRSEATGVQLDDFRFTFGAPRQVGGGLFDRIRAPPPLTPPHA